MALLDKIKGKWDDMVNNAAQKLAYSEEDIAARKQKEGIQFVFDGGNGTLLEVYEDRVVLYHNKSLFGKYAPLFEGNIGEKTIYFTDISSIEFKEAQKMCIGYIRFSILHGGETRKSVADAAQDPNSVAIGRVDRNEEAADIARQLNRMMSKTRQKDNNNILVQAASSADEIKKYKDLLDSGVITQEEFDTKKKELLGL